MFGQHLHHLKHDNTMIRITFGGAGRNINWLLVTPWHLPSGLQFPCKFCLIYVIRYLHSHISPRGYIGNGAGLLGIELETLLLPGVTAASQHSTVLGSFRNQTSPFIPLFSYFTDTFCRKLIFLAKISF